MQQNNIFLLADSKLLEKANTKVIIKRLYSLKEAGLALGVSSETIRLLVHEGSLKALKIKSKLLIKDTELFNFVEKLESLG